MPSVGIRKFTMSKSMIEEIREYAWANRKSVSQIAQELMVEMDKDHLRYVGQDDPLTKPSALLTLYVPDELWEPVISKMQADGYSMSRAVRVYFRELLNS
jgi:hypothetical protein